MRLLNIEMFMSTTSNYAVKMLRAELDAFTLEKSNDGSYRIMITQEMFPLQHLNFCNRIQLQHIYLLVGSLLVLVLLVFVWHWHPCTVTYLLVQLPKYFT